MTTQTVNLIIGKWTAPFTIIHMARTMVEQLENHTILESSELWGVWSHGSGKKLFQGQAGIIA